LTQTLYPLVLEPKLTQAIWGGDALVTKFHKHGDTNIKFGESWECWDENRIANGALAGKTVAQAREQLGAALLGNIDQHRIFPILTKIIEARDWLSVQVHPDDGYAQRIEKQPFGKTECWYVLEATPHAELVLGWSHDTNRAEYERRVADGSLGEILRRVPVKAGEAYYLPAGSLHAIGAGITVFEVQQASDLTYRIFDWNRIGSDGKARALHVKKAADVLDYKQGARDALAPLTYNYAGLRRTVLIADARFTLERIVAGSEPSSLPTEERPLIIMALGTPLEVGIDRESIELGPYQTALIPAASKWCALAARAGREAAFMLATPPARSNAVAIHLLAAGVEQTRVDSFMEQFAP
jgi:mannose-6-phosphate isomerase